MFNSFAQPWDWDEAFILELGMHPDSFDLATKKHIPGREDDKWSKVLRMKRYMEDNKEAMETGPGRASFVKLLDEDTLERWLPWQVMVVVG